MLPTEEYLEQLRQIKRAVINKLRNIDGVDYLFWRVMWNMHDVGPRWIIYIRSLSKNNNLDRLTFNEKELILINTFQDARWNFGQSDADYPSFENLNWNMNNAGFVDMDQLN